MERRLRIERKARDKIREHIVNLIMSDVVLPRGDREQELLTIAEQVDISTATYPTPPIEGEIVTDNQLHQFLDALFLDHSIHYYDLYQLEDYLRNIEDIFKSGTLTILDEAENALSKLKSIKELDGRLKNCTDIYHNNFNRDSNVPVSGNRLKVNPSANRLTLNYGKTERATPEGTNIYITPLTSNAEIIDITDSSGAYSNNPTSPAYITCSTWGSPVNIDRGNLLIEHYPGMIYDFTITFPSIVPVNSIVFRPFSNSEIEVVGIYYSGMEDPAWVHTQMNWTVTNEILGEGTEIEVNFDRVYAREIHIVIYQKGFKKTKEDIILDTNTKFTDFQNYLKECLFSGLNKGTPFGSTLEEQVNYIRSQIKDRLKGRTITIPENSRIYTFGLYGLKVQDRTYELFGQYRDRVVSMDGSLLGTALSVHGETTPMLGNTPLGTTLFELNAFGKKIPFSVPVELTIEDYTGEVIVDISEIIELNDKIYVLCSFTPMDAESVSFVENKEIEPIEIVEGSRITLINDRNAIEVDPEFAETRGLYPGRYICTLYVPAILDLRGNFIDPLQSDLPLDAGRPNIDDNDITGFTDRYFYVQYDKDNPNLYSEYSAFVNGLVQIDDREFYSLGEGKGEYYFKSDGVFSGNPDMYKDGDDDIYISERLVIGPIDDFYAGIMGEKCSYDNTNQNYKTEFPYIKGTLRVFYPPEERYLQEGIQEYNTDTIEEFTYDKRVFNLANITDEVIVSYIPIHMNEFVQVENVTITYDTLEVNNDESIWLSVDVNPEESTFKTVTWESNNESVAIVDSLGKVTGISGGTVDITVETIDGKASDIVTVTVKQLAKGISLDPSEPQTLIKDGDSILITVIFDPETTTNKEVIWTEDRPDTVSITIDPETPDQATIHGVSVGEVTLMATSVCGGFTAEIVINVEEDEMF